MKQIMFLMFDVKFKCPDIRVVPRSSFFAPHRTVPYRTVVVVVAVVVALVLLLLLLVLVLTLVIGISISISISTSISISISIGTDIVICIYICIGIVIGISVGISIGISSWWTGSITPKPPPSPVRLYCMSIVTDHSLQYLCSHISARSRPYLG